MPRYRHFQQFFENKGKVKVMTYFLNMLILSQGYPEYIIFSFALTTVSEAYAIACCPSCVRACVCVWPFPSVRHGFLVSNRRADPFQTSQAYSAWSPDQRLVSDFWSDLWPPRNRSKGQTMDLEPWDMKYCFKYIVVMHIYTGKQGK